MIKKLLTSTLLVGGMTFLQASCPINILNPEINPKPLVDKGLGDISFEIFEDAGKIVLKEDDSSTATCEFNVEMHYITLKDNNIQNITGTALKYFDITFNQVENLIYFKQKIDIPADTYANIDIKIDVIKPSSSIELFNGFQVNIINSNVKGNEFTFTQERGKIHKSQVIQEKYTDPTNIRSKIKGTCKAKNKINIQIDRKKAHTLLCTDEETFSMLSSMTLTDNEHNITATQTDDNGNIVPVDSLRIENIHIKDNE